MAHGRRMIAVVLLAVAAAAVPLAAVAWWESRTVSDEEGFVATFAPLAEEQDVQDRVSDEAVDQVMTPIEDRLPGVLSDGVRGTVESTVRDVVESDEFVAAWEDALRDLHPDLVATLADEDDGELLVVDGDEVGLRLTTLSDPIRDALGDAGVPGADLLPDLEITVPVATTEQLRAGQSAYAVVHGRLLPALAAAVVLLIAGTAVAPHRLRAALAGAVLVLGALLLALVALLGGRARAVARLSSENQAIGREALGRLTEDLQSSLAILATLAFLVVIVLALLWLTIRRSGRAGG